jgi:hypothetical protein
MMGVALVSKETYCKRDLRKCQKRPTQVSKETYASVKRDLLQKRPTQVSKGPTAQAAIHEFENRSL